MNAAVLPVKRPADSLTRLAGLLSLGEREELATGLFRRALGVLGAIPKLDELIVVSMDRAVLDTASNNGARVLEEADQLSHSHSVERGVVMALGLGAQTVLSAAIDVPLATSAEYEELGTNALVRTPPDVIVSGFGPGSFERHINAGRGAGAEVRATRPLGLVLDLDTPKDLLAIEERAEDTNDVLDFLSGIGALDRARAMVS